MARSGSLARLFNTTPTHFKPACLNGANREQDVIQTSEAVFRDDDDRQVQIHRQIVAEIVGCDRNHPPAHSLDRDKIDARA